MRGWPFEKRTFNRLWKPKGRGRASLARGQGYLDSSLEAYTDFAEAVTVEFVGYGQDEAKVQLLGIIVEGESVDQAEQGTKAAFILNRTPFMQRGGGQVADTGVIESSTGRVRISDVRRPVEG